MTLFVYADESGVFDHLNGRYFVFGGLIFVDKKSKDDHSRKYLHAERVIREKRRNRDLGELKGCALPPGDKDNLFRATNNSYRFSIVIDMSMIHEQIFKSKKDKQRYQDFAFKIGLKRAVENLISRSVIDRNYSEELHVFMDEHTTATNGHYELQEALEAEFKRGTFNQSWKIYYPPVLPNLKHVKLELRDSRSVTLIRAADIIANKVFYHLRSDTLSKVDGRVFVARLP